MNMEEPKQNQKKQKKKKAKGKTQIIRIVLEGRSRPNLKKKNTPCPRYDPMMTVQVEDFGRD